MSRLAVAAALAALLTGGAAQAGSFAGSVDTVPLVEFPGANPYVRGALYNTPPAVIFAAYSYRRYHHRRVVLRARY